MHDRLVRLPNPLTIEVSSGCPSAVSASAGLETKGQTDYDSGSSVVRRMRNGRVVGIYYTLRFPEGESIDSPLPYFPEALNRWRQI